MSNVYQKLTPYLQLLRPPNLVTAMADVVAGFAIAGGLLHFAQHIPGDWAVSLPWEALGWLLVSTVALYAGGVAFNDIFDLELDKQERPERPLPSGRADLRTAIFMSLTLLFVGIFSAWMASPTSGLIALLVAFLAVLYDFAGKHHPIFGPLNMGLTRAGNLMLGVSALPAALEQYWFIGLVPVVFIAAVTMVSRGEVHGGKSPNLFFALLMYATVIGSIASLGILEEVNLYLTLPFLAFFGLMVFPPLLRAWRDPIPPKIGKAVKAGVLSLIAMDAALAAGFGGLYFGLATLLLLPLSFLLARLFAVT